MERPTLSIILTAAREPLTIKKALQNLLISTKSFLKNDFELITVSPDEETITNTAQFINTNYPRIRYINIKDPYKGKPTALNMAFKKATGDYILLSDGDVYISKNSVAELFSHFQDPKVAAVTGRPRSQDPKDNFWGYLSHLLADGAHHKRMLTMTAHPAGHSLKLVSTTPSFFVISGYLSLIKNLKYEIPADCLVDDAYLSYTIFNKGLKLNYEPKAKVYVKYPNNLKDWLNQKARSVGGYMQLWSYGIVKEDTKVRSFFKELEYFWFPIKYATNIKELFWSLLLYFLRSYLWLRIFWEQRILKKDFYKTWVRIESTK